MRQTFSCPTSEKITYDDKYLWNELVVLLLPEQSSPSQERSVCRSSSQRTHFITYTELVVDHVVMQVAHKQSRWVCLLLLLHAFHVPIDVLKSSS